MALLGLRLVGGGSAGRTELAGPGEPLHRAQLEPLGTHAGLHRPHEGGEGDLGLGQASCLPGSLRRRPPALEAGPQRRTVRVGVGEVVGQAAVDALDGGARGEFERGLGLIERAREIAARFVEPEPVSMAHLYQVYGTQALFRGDNQSFAELNMRAAEQCVAAGDLRREASVRASVGYALTELGQHEASERELRAVLANAAAIGVVSLTALAANNLGLTLARLRRLDEAREFQELAIRIKTEHGDRRTEGCSRAYLALVLVELGELSAALEQAELAVERLQSARALLALAHAACARVHLAQGDTRAALTHTETAMESLLAYGAEDGAALVRLVRAEALATVGREGEARETIQRARAELVERAGRIQNPEWRKSFLERVPENARTIALATEWEG